MLALDGLPYCLHSPMAALPRMRWPGSEQMEIDEAGFATVVTALVTTS
jgi:hypothetical protein